MAGLMDKLKELVKEREGQIRSAVDKAGGFVDDKTKGKYHDKIAKANEKAGHAIDKATADGKKTDDTAASSESSESSSESQPAASAEPTAATETETPQASAETPAADKPAEGGADADKPSA